MRPDSEILLEGREIEPLNVFPNLFLKYLQPNMQKHVVLFGFF